MSVIVDRAVVLGLVAGGAHAARPRSQPTPHGAIKVPLATQPLGRGHGRRSGGVGLQEAA